MAISCTSGGEMLKICLTLYILAGAVAWWLDYRERHRQKGNDDAQSKR